MVTPTLTRTICCSFEQQQVLNQFQCEVQKATPCSCRRGGISNHNAAPTTVRVPCLMFKQEVVVNERRKTTKANPPRPCERGKTWSLSPEGDQQHEANDSCRRSLPPANNINAKRPNQNDCRGEMPMKIQKRPCKRHAKCN